MITWIWPEHPAPAPIPMVGIESRSVIAAASWPGTSSSTTAKAPASWTASASASSCRACSRLLPWTRTLPIALMACGVSPMWPMTGIPAFTIASIVRALRTPPSTLTACVPPSRRNRPALATASSGVAYERNGMSPTISARFVPRTTAFVWWSISSIVTRTVVS